MPKDLDLEENDTNESDEKTEKGGMGLADGEGTKDVSDRIESEDQLEDARPADQEQEKQDDKTCEEEEKGIDMSEDFDSKLQDIEKNDNEEQSDNDEENDLDKEMGQTGEGAEQLDKEIWGDDEEESEEDNQQPENENVEEGMGEQIDEKKLGMTNDIDNEKQDNNEDTDHDDNQQKKNKEEINELNEPEVDEDQINPYHGKFQPQPEPEPLDLPEDLNLDEEGKEDNGDEEENPFDIDEMKKPSPEKQDVELEKESEETEENDLEETSSENENENNENTDTENRKAEELETNKETEEKSKESAEAKDKDEEQNQDDKTEEEKQNKAEPNNTSNQMDAAQSEEMEGSRDAVAQQSDMKAQQETSAENNQNNESNDKGTGQSQSAQQESGHLGSSQQETTLAPQNDAMTKLIEKRKNPGESNEDRSLLDRFEPTLKKLKTIYSQDEMSKNREDNASNADGNQAEMAQHIKDSERFDDYTLDAATEDQIKQQASNMDKNKSEEEKQDDTADVEMHEDKKNDVDDKINEQKPEKVSEIANNKCKKDSDGKRHNVDDGQTETTVELEGEIAETTKVQRGNESTFHTMEWSIEKNDFDFDYTKEKRSEVEKMLGEWTQVPSTEEATAAWNCLCSVTDAAARDLSEKLRLVLEPTQTSRLKGDYKTGKRINMRKIIPYIASQFRKDKIWLRRTKPSKRDYQIILAVDDSKSMANNLAKELTFESFSLISKAMTYLEVGQLGVISFGEQVKVVHPLGEAFTEQSGSRYLPLHNLYIHLIFN